MAAYEGVSVICFFYKFYKPVSEWILTEDSFKTIHRLESDTCDLYFTLRSRVVHTLWIVLETSPNYRKAVLKYSQKIAKRNVILVTVNEISDQKELLDNAWNIRLNRLVYERVQLDTAMSYLSTLGGAFSALGDYHDEFAKTAGQISWKQLRLAIRLGEDPLAARCRLYMAISLIQQGNLHFAKTVILSQLKIARDFADIKLQNMCKGIWAKLQFARKQRRMLAITE